jgi:acetyl esterase/lipase
VIRRIAAGLVVALILALAAAAASAQQSDWSEQGAFAWTVSPSLVYTTAGGIPLKLDVYAPASAPAKPVAPVPVVISFHGGGWVTGSKESDVLRPMPYLALGMAVVNVEYRLAGAAPAPAAVQDCRCALRWVVRNAEKYHFDPTRIIATGASAGGHLALMTGMLRASDGFDRGCPGGGDARWTGPDRSDPKVAAIVNWSGITDVRDLLDDGANPRSYAIEWIGDRDDDDDLAERVSPLTYVRADLPPILSIHGDGDAVVPASHSTRLHDALQKAGAPSQLLLVHGAGHADFTPAQVREAWETVRAFLRKNGLLR